MTLHEFGHVISEEDGFDAAPGGQHKFPDLIAVKLAWSGGWGNYFQDAAQDWENRQACNERLPNVSLADGTSSIRGTVTIYLDKIDLDIEWSLERRNTYKFAGHAQVEAQGDRNEMAVARVLWNLMDGTGRTEGKKDELTLGHSKVFELARRPLPVARMQHRH